jgi:hypothetical protein
MNDDLAVRNELVRTIMPMWEQADGVVTLLEALTRILYHVGLFSTGGRPEPGTFARRPALFVRPDVTADFRCSPRHPDLAFHALFTLKRGKLPVWGAPIAMHNRGGVLDPTNGS